MKSSVLNVNVGLNCNCRMSSGHGSSGPPNRKLRKLSSSKPMSSSCRTDGDQKKLSQFFKKSEPGQPAMNYGESPGPGMNTMNLPVEPS